MKKTTKLLLLSSALVGAVLTTKAAASTKSIDINDKLIETADDITNKNAIPFKKGIKIGSDDKVSMSKTFVQIGTQTIEGKEYDVMRFATAIKGKIDSISYQRGYVVGKDDIPPKEVVTLYKGIIADGKTYYYNGTSQTTTESYAGEYYWACYTIRYTTSNLDFYNVPIQIIVNGNKGTETEATLASLKGETHIHTFDQNIVRDKFKKSGRTYYKSCICGEHSDTETFNAYQFVLTKGATFADGSTKKLFGNGQTVSGIQVPEQNGYHHVGFMKVNDILDYKQLFNAKFTLDKITADTIIEPYYDANSYTNNMSTANGKIDLLASGSQVNRMNGITSVSKYVGAIHNENGVSEQAAIFSPDNKSGSVKIGDWFNWMAPMKVSGEHMLVTYRIQNLGTEKIGLDVQQIGASGDATNEEALGQNARPNKSLILDIGELAVFTMELPVNIYSNNNVLTNYKFTGNMRTKPIIGVTQYFEKVTSTIPTHKVTIQNGKDTNFAVNFKKDNPNSRSITEGTTISNLKVTAPEGYTLAGWVDANNSAKVYNANNYVVKEDVTLIPYFDKNTSINTSLKGSTAPIHTKINGFNRSSLIDQMSSSVVNVDGHLEKENTFNYAGGVQAGWYFISMIPTSVSSGVTYEFTFILTNNGEEELNISLFQTNASGSPEAAGNANETFTIASKETKTIVLTASNLSNANIMTYYKFNNATTSNLSLTVKEYLVIAA